MAGKKIFIGPKLREMRKNRGLTQAEMAKELGVSPSYINLIERNQRNASLKFLISLSDAFGLNWREWTNSGEGLVLSDLRQMTQDPVFGDILPDIEELRNALDGSPNFTRGVFNIFNAYRSYGERLAEQNEMIGAATELQSADQYVHDFFRSKNNYFADLEACAAKSPMQDLADRQEIYGALRHHLEKKLGVSVFHVRDEVLGSNLRHYDPDKKIISLSDGLDHNNQVFQLAHMIALIEHSDLMARQMPEDLRSKERAVARIRIELANYFAAAVMMPYQAFFEEAERTHYDIDRLASRFTVSYEQVCHRLTTLQKPGKRGIPFFFLRIDRGGNVSKRFNATPIQLARYGGACPKLDVHYCFRVPGRIMTQMVEMPDHSRYLTINRTVDRPTIRYTTEDKRLAVSLGCPIEYAQETIYGHGMDLKSDRLVTRIGVNCRLCPREQCEQRAHEPFHTRLNLDEFTRGSTHLES